MQSKFLQNPIIRRAALAIGIAAGVSGVFGIGYLNGYLMTEPRREIRIISCDGKTGQDVLVGVTTRGDGVIKRILQSLDGTTVQPRITGMLVRTCESGVDVRGLVIPDANKALANIRPSNTALGVLTGLLVSDNEPSIVGRTPISRMGLFTDGRTAVAESIGEMLQR